MHLFGSGSSGLGAARPLRQHGARGGYGKCPLAGSGDICFERPCLFSGRLLGILTDQFLMTSFFPVQRDFCILLRSRAFNLLAG